MTTLTNPKLTTQTKLNAPSMGWWLVAKRELYDHWVGGRAMILVILFSVLLGVMTFLMASNAELKLLSPPEMVFTTVQITIVVGIFIGLLIGADSISGERERATLEGLLLVPTSRRQLVTGKFISAISPWFAVLFIATIHLAIIAPNRFVFGEALLLSGVMGTVLVVGFTAFAMLTSIWSNSNRTSLFVNLFVAILFLIPTQMAPQTGFMGQLVKRLNPMESVNQFVEKIVVNNRTFAEMSSWLVAPIVFLVLTTVLLFIVVAPRLALDADKAKLRFRKPTGVVSLLLLWGLFATAPPLFAQSPAESSIRIEIDTAVENVKTSDTVFFQTVVVNEGETTSAPLVVAMNIVNLGKDGDPVDPEDWSPERTQGIDPLGAGESVALAWEINAILEGVFLTTEKVST